MKIGLVRHFKVKLTPPQKKLVSLNELTRWFEQYDAAEVEHTVTDLGGIDWKKCYSSDLKRAAQTACCIYDGPIELRAELREIPLPDFKLNIKLPFLLWAILTRLAWLTNREMRQVIKDTKGRIRGMLDEIMQNHEEKEILIVGHGASMMFLQKELLKRGFTGRRIISPKNGKLYIFERK